MSFDKSQCAPQKLDEASLAAPPEPAPGLLLIQRMSVLYDGSEDRIALDISSRQNAVARLWLTRHGADVLVRATSARIEAYATTRIASANVPPGAAGPLRQSALEAQQLTARLTQRGAQAVKLPPGTLEYLVTGISMPDNPKGTRIDFLCKPALPARVVLQSAELFQWLAALQRQYLKAGWATDVWPAWLMQQAIN